MEDFDDFFEDNHQREELMCLSDVEIIDLVERSAETYRLNQFINAAQAKEYGEDLLLSTAITRATVHPSDRHFHEEVLLHFNNQERTAIATLCTFIVVKGRPKMGKTTALVWIAAALFGCPNLPYVGVAHVDHLLWVDSEQSRVHIGLIRHRIASLMPVDVDWHARLTLLSLRPYSPQARLRLIECSVAANPKIRVLLIDNLADLTTSILDDVEAGELMRRLFRLIESRRLLVIAVLHTNKSNSHSRGHLGSLADQRAEVLLSVERSEGIMRVEAELTRNSPIPTVEYMVTNGNFQFLSERPKAKSKPMKSQFNKVSNEVHKAVITEIFVDQREMKPGEFKARLTDVYAKHVGAIGEELRKGLQRFYIDQNLINKQNGKLRMTE